MKTYLEQFEKEVLIPLFKKEKRTPEPVPLKKGKIHLTEFGNFIESSFDCDQILAFDYYGLFKISKKIIDLHKQNIKTFPCIKIINSPVIHFSSVKKEQIHELAPHLYNKFDDFKNYLVKLRWNK